MSSLEVVNRIIADAEEEARAIIARAEEGAQKTLDNAKELAARELAGTQAEIAEKSKAISDGKSAAARLDCAKLQLAEKRRVIETVYMRAAEKLCSLDEKSSLKLIEALLLKYAENGDEVVFAKNYPYAEKAAKLKPFTEKKLKLSSERVITDGGFILRGMACDKDVSFGALLAEDREKNEAKIAQRLFKNK